MELKPDYIFSAFVFKGRKKVQFRVFNQSNKAWDKMQ